MKTFAGYEFPKRTFLDMASPANLRDSADPPVACESDVVACVNNDGDDNDDDDDDDDDNHDGVGDGLHFCSSKLFIASSNP